MGRAQALNPATLLVDEDQDVIAPDGLLEGRYELSDLVRALDIAGEQDQAAGALAREKFPLGVGKRLAGAPCDESFEIHARG
jgi:hypothetical protein